MFSGARECTMSRSNVEMGAPFNTADTPPTTTKSTWFADKVSRIAAESTVGESVTQLLDRSNVLLQHLQSLGGSQRKHSADKRQIDAVIAVLGLRRVIARQRRVLDGFVGQ